MTARLEVDDVRVDLGGVRALDGVGFTIEPGSVTGLIGPNGAGKTTLLDVISGFVRPSTGSVRLDGTTLPRPPHERARRGIARTFQSLELFEDLGIADNLQLAGADAAAAVAAAERLRLDLHDERAVAELSQGERARVALARAVAGRPALLLLDEPAAGLDVAARRELVDVVRDVAAAGTSVLLVDHDLALVLEVCDRILVLHLGAVVADGPPDAVRRDPTVAEIYVGSATTSAPRPALTTTPREPAVRARGLRAGYGSGDVVRGVDLDVAGGEIVALLGANGAGKTTTLLALSGALRNVAGDVEVLGRRTARRRLKPSPGVAHVLQSRRVFAGLSARENLRLATRSMPDIEAAVAVFPALHGVLDRPAGRLSGGEQQMLAVARALATQPRLLLVDELSLGLAPKVVSDLLTALRSYADDHGVAILLAEQHGLLALDVADRGYVLAAGHVTMSGSARELAADPDALLAAYLGESATG